MDEQRTRTLLRNACGLIATLEESDEDEDRLRGLAHLWALLELVISGQVWAPMPVPASAIGPREAHQMAAAGGLRLSSIVEGLRAHLTSQAFALQATFRRHPRNRPIRLERVWDGEDEQLGGTVSWAYREKPSTWARHLSWREEGPHAVDYRRLPSMVSGPFAFVWNRTATPKVVLHGPSRSFALGTRICLCPGPTDVWPRLLRTSPWHFRTCPVQPLSGPGHLPSWLGQSLDLAEQHKASLVVLPELMVPAELGVDPCFRRSFALVPGSAHIEKGQQLRNAAALRHANVDVLTHHKAGRFRLNSKQWCALHAADANHVDAAHHHLVPDGFELPSGGGEVVEGIVPGTELHVLECGLARVSILICADLLDVGAQLRHLVEVAQVELLIVPSFTPETAPFVQAADQLRGLRVAVAWVNAAAALAGAGEDQLLALVSLPIRTIGLPTRLYWWRDKGLCDEQGDTWRHRSAAELLPEGRGLLVDLARWLDEVNKSE